MRTWLVNVHSTTALEYIILSCFPGYWSWFFGGSSFLLGFIWLSWGITPLALRSVSTSSLKVKYAVRFARFARELGFVRSVLIRFSDRPEVCWRGFRLSRLRPQRFSVQVYLYFSVVSRFPFSAPFVPIPRVNLPKVTAVASVDSPISAGCSAVRFPSSVLRLQLSAVLLTTRFS